MLCWFVEIAFVPKRLLNLLCCFAIVGPVCAQNCVPQVTAPNPTSFPVHNILFENAALLTSEDQHEIVEKSMGISIAGKPAKKNVVGAADEIGELVRMV